MSNSAMNTDADLLRRYIHDRAEAAFTELVERHLGLVYSVALRRVGGDRHLAEDVTQRVFSVLARKAPTLVGRPTLSGWLYTSAHLTSAAVVRSERRRKVHETDAQIMQATHSSPEAAADWTQLRPVIDDVIVILKEDDREAIALRFFEKRTFAEVGIALRVTEEAARKRVDRALEKLRAVLAQRGITSTTVALGIALPAFAAADSPAGLLGKVANHALATAPSPSLVGTILQSTWPAAAAILAGGLMMVSQHRANETLRVELTARLLSKSELASLRAENQQLVQGLVASEPAENPERLSLPVSEEQKARFDAGLWGSASPQPNESVTRSVVAILTISAHGTLTWNQDLVSLDEYNDRLRRLQERQEIDPRVGIHIRTLGSIAEPKYRAVIEYVFAEARRTKIRNVSTEPQPAPRSKEGLWWF